uniref:Family with sequence similarity 60, member A, like n=1 Tax=Nothobranchius kuhntae TaxID=321403 RepID=A0A1A8J107_NOTKU
MVCAVLVGLNMSERKRSHVWSSFSSSDKNDAVCDICRKTVRHCGNTTNLVKHLKVNHKKEYDDFMVKRTEDERSEPGAAAAARVKQTSLVESFGASGRHYPGKLKSYTEQLNGSVNQAEGSIAIYVKHEALDRISGNSWSHLHQNPSPNSVSHSAEVKDATFPASYFTAPGTSGLIRPLLNQSESEKDASSQHTALHDAVDLSKRDHQQRTEALEEQQQMKILEWDNRMKLLAWEKELMREKRRAVRQKEKAFRMKKIYYKAKLRRLGEDVPQSSSSSGDEEEKPSDLTG